MSKSNKRDMIPLPSLLPLSAPWPGHTSAEHVYVTRHYGVLTFYARETSLRLVCREPGLVDYALVAMARALCDCEAKGKC